VAEKRARSVAERLSRLFRKAGVFLAKAQYQEALAVFRDGEALAQSLGDAEKLALFREEIARCEQYLRDPSPRSGSRLTDGRRFTVAVPRGIANGKTTLHMPLPEYSRCCGINRQRQWIDHDAILLFRTLQRDVTVPYIVQHSLWIAFEGIAPATTATRTVR
jgi:hypothetical protein